MAQKKFRMGIIGIGGMGGGHLSAATRSKKIELVSVCDVNKEIVDKAVKDHKVAGFTDMKEFYDNSDIEGVIICVPHDMYMYPVSEACRRGIHILKEKPLARNMKEANEMVNITKKAGVKFMIATNRRYNLAFYKMKSFVEKTGRVYMARGQYCFVWGADFGWRGILKRAGGGALHDMGYHTVDMMIWYLGMPDEVYCYKTIGRVPANYNTEDSAITMFKFKNGPIGYLLTSWITNPSEQTFYVHGSKGSVVASGSDLILRDPVGKELQKIDVGKIGGDSLLNQLEHFVDCVRKNKTPLSDGKENLKNMAFIEASYASEKSGRPVNPKKYL